MASGAPGRAGGVLQLLLQSTPKPKKSQWEGCRSSAPLVVNGTEGFREAAFPEPVLDELLRPRRGDLDKWKHVCEQGLSLTKKKSPVFHYERNMWCDSVNIKYTQIWGRTALCCWKSGWKELPRKYEQGFLWSGGWWSLAWLKSQVPSACERASGIHFWYNVHFLVCVLHFKEVPFLKKKKKESVIYLTFNPMCLTAAAGLSCVTRISTVAHGLSSCITRLSCSTACGVSVVQPEIELESPALQDGFSTRSVCFLMCSL